MPFSLAINGRPHRVDVPADMPLLWVLRNELGLVGTKFGCGGGFCGACTVHLDGQPTRACQTPVGSVGNARITTIEAVGATPQGAALQRAWIDIDVPQCGYCQAGQIMMAAALLRQTPHPTQDEIEGTMAGNLCRCASYHRIIEAIGNAAAESHSNTKETGHGQ